MGLDLLKEILLAILNGACDVPYYGGISLINGVSSLLDSGNVFQCQTLIKDWFNVDISSIESAVFGIAYWFLILKFVWKGFNIYILGVDGDEDSDPMVLVFNFVKALAISICFGILFESFMNIGFDVLSKIKNVLQFKYEFSQTFQDFVEKCATSLVLLIMFIVYFIMVIVLTVKFMKNSLELVILRCGISFAVSGLLDSDQGVFKPYVKKFFQITWTVILQSVCFKLSVLALANANLLPCIMAMSMALTAPQFLAEFIMTNQGGGGKLQQLLYSFSIMRSFSR